MRQSALQWRKGMQGAVHGGVQGQRRGLGKETHSG